MTRAYRNPECRDGKHLNCSEAAWDDELDQLTDCTCTCHDSDEGMHP